MYWAELIHNLLYHLDKLLVGFFLFMTSPTASHAVANAAWQAGLKPLLGHFRAPRPDEIRQHPELAGKTDLKGAGPGPERTGNTSQTMSKSSRATPHTHTLQERTQP